MANPTTRVLWWALVASLFVYVGVALVVAPDGTPSPVAGALAPVLGVVAVGLGIGTIVYRRRALVEPIQSGRLDPRTPEGMGRALPAFILNVVLSESVAIFGLVLSLLAASPFYAVAFAAGALVLMVVHRPTASELEPPISTNAP